MSGAGSEPADKPTVTASLNAAADRASRQLLFIMVMAAPWEIFQRTELGGLTLVKLAGTTLIAVTVLRMALTRTWSIPRTGLEIPLGLLVVIGALCTAHSLDHAASWALFRVYLTYIALFHATAGAVRDRADAERFILALLVSSAMVSALALLCAAGRLTPSMSHVTEYVNHRVVPGARHDAPLRVVAASDDFNQGVFIPLMAFALALFTFGRRSLGVARRLGLYAALTLLLGAMLVAVSRSSVTLAICLIAVYLFGQVRARLRAMPVIVALVLIVGIGGAVGHRYLQALATRTTSVSSHDPSYEGRRYGYTVAWRALPRYALTGAGLNTSDVILSRAGHPEILRGQTLHSVPFKLLLETGVLGLLAYLFLIGAFVTRLWRDGVRGHSGCARSFSMAFLAWLAVCFLVTCVQPLNALSMFPVMAGLALGPLTRSDSARAGAASGCGAGATEPADSSRPDMPSNIAHESLDAGAAPDARSGDLGRHSNAPRRRVYSGDLPTGCARRDAAIAALIVAIVVAPNALQYQKYAPRVARFADSLENGSRREKAAEWAAAEEGYSAAAALAEWRAENERSEWRQPIDAAPYFFNAASVYDLEQVYKGMALGRIGAAPCAAAEFALARSVMTQGRLADAVDHFDRALRYDPGYADAWFAKGECYWASGVFKRAVEAYAQAATLAASPRNEAYAEKLNALAGRIDALGKLNPVEPAALLEAARLWRLRGDWNTALALYRKVAVLAPDSADAHFHLGVNAEIRGDGNQAVSEYDTALRLAPNHFESARRLRELRLGSGAQYH